MSPEHAQHGILYHVQGGSHTSLAFHLRSHVFLCSGVLAIFVIFIQLDLPVVIPGTPNRITKGVVKVLGT